LAAGSGLSGVVARAATGAGLVGAPLASAAGWGFLVAGGCCGRLGSGSGSAASASSAACRAGACVGAPDVGLVGVDPAAAGFDVVVTVDSLSGWCVVGDEFWADSRFA
jgi:hypothetical protein